MQAVDKAIQVARKEVGIKAYWIMDPFVAKRLGYKGDEEHLLLHQSLIPAGPVGEGILYSICFSVQYLILSLKTQSSP
jgi:hypothetical protein